MEKKLNLKAGVTLSGVKTTSTADDAVLVFVAGQLGTDLNRDIVWKHMLKHGVQAVRQIAIDEVWSALRFRPAK